MYLRHKRRWTRYIKLTLNAHKQSHTILGAYLRTSAQLTAHNRSRALISALWARAWRNNFMKRLLLARAAGLLLFSSPAGLELRLLWRKHRMRTGSNANTLFSSTMLFSEMHSLWICVCVVFWFNHLKNLFINSTLKSTIRCWVHIV